VRTRQRVVTADNLSIGVGVQPWVPSQVRPALCDTQFHVGEFVHKARGLGGKRVAVVGGGQSGAEAFLDLLSRPDGETPRRVSWVSRRRNYFPIDDSPFTNDFYMPGYAEHFYGLDRATRERLNVTNILTSDGIAEATLRAIYQRVYTHRFINGAADLVELCPNRTVTHVASDGDGGWDIAVVDNDRPDLAAHVAADVIVWATGFRPARMDFLAPLDARLEREGDEYRVDEDFAICWDGPADHRIFVLNGARQQRGLADMNLSLIAWRSQRIVDRLLGVQSAEQLPSFIDWSPGPAAREVEDLLRGA